jgi:hypothetical protein
VEKDNPKFWAAFVFFIKLPILKKRKFGKSGHPGADVVVDENRNMFSFDEFRGKCLSFSSPFYFNVTAFTIVK